MALGLSKIQVQKSLMLRGRLFSGGGSDIITSIVAHTGGKYIEHGSKPVHSVLSVHDARPRIIDALLSVIFRRW